MRLIFTLHLILYIPRDFISLCYYNVSHNDTLVREKDDQSANLIDQVYAYGANTARTFAWTREVRNHAREMHYRRETEIKKKKEKRKMERETNYLGTRHFMLSHSSYTYPSSFFLVVMKVAWCLDISKYTGFSSSATELEDDAFPKGLRLYVNDRLEDFVSKSLTCDFHILENWLQIYFLLRLKYQFVKCENYLSGFRNINSDFERFAELSVKTGSRNMYWSDMRIFN